MGFCYIFNSCLQKFRKAETYAMNYMFILLCELFVILKYDEMNCDFVSRVFLHMYFEMQILVI
jgi:hypothetical protein